MTVRIAALTLLVGAVFFCACNDDATPRWTERGAELGLNFRHQSGGRGDYHLPEIMGGGVALFDADADGDLDLYLTNGNLDPARGNSTADDPVNRFFAWESDRFVDRTERSGLGDSGYGMGVATGDIDNDGDLDLYLANFGADRLFVNAGDGTFVDKTAAAGIDVDGWSSSATFFDYDRDGWLDLFVTRYLHYRPAEQCTDAAGRRDYCGPSVFAPQSDLLFHNLGAGKFEDVSIESGIFRGIGHGLGVVAFDANGDSRPDLYVANDGDPNQLWVQTEDGSFNDEALLRGVAYNQAGETEAGMGVLAADLDADGRWDLFVTHLAEESNTLYRGEPQTFRDASGSSGLGAVSRAHTGFGTATIDFNLDGRLDLAVVNGRVSGGFEHGEGWDRFNERNHFYENLGAGRFRLLPWGDRAAISRGLAAGDLDGDGDLDLVVANIEGHPQVWINECPSERRRLVVRALLTSGRDAYGAVVRLEHGGQELLRRIDAGGGYLSSREPLARFGLGTEPLGASVEIRWPDGQREQFPITDGDRSIVVMQGQGMTP